MTTLRTPREVAERLRCSLRTLSDHVKAGHIKYIIIGHGKKRPRRMFTDADVDAFIERQTRRESLPSLPEPTRRFRAARNAKSGAEVFDIAVQFGVGAKPPHTK